MGRRAACAGLAALLIASVSSCSCTGEHVWLPLPGSAADSTAVPQSSNRQLQSAGITSRLRLRERRGVGGSQQALGSAAACKGEAAGDRETRLPILVIGLKHRMEERLANFLLKLRWYEDLHVVEAVDGRTLDPMGGMTSGEVACFESHRKAWARIVEEDWRQAIVMEDDAEVDLSEHMPRVAQFVADAPPDWQLLYLGINNANDIRNLSSTVAEPLHYVMGTHAYVLRNSVAARLHALSEEPPYKSSYLPVDMFLTQKGLKIYIINPPLVKQRNFGDTDTQGIRVKTLNATTEEEASAAAISDEATAVESAAPGA